MGRAEVVTITDDDDDTLSVVMIYSSWLDYELLLAAPHTISNNIASIYFPIGGTHGPFPVWIGMPANASSCPQERSLLSVCE